MLSNVKGHKDVRALLANLITSNRVGHAYLFSGPEGVGKAFTALEFFKLLSCPDAVEGEPCNRCHVCRGIGDLSFPDLHILGPVPGSDERVSTIKISDIRGLNDFINYPPIQGPYKMILVNDAHLMTIEAANALLKVLEEPPRATIFILVTALEGRLPITIRSRCTQVWFGSLDAKSIADVLVNQGVDLSLIPRLSTAAGGSVSMAMRLARPEVWAFRNEVTDHILKAMTLPANQRYPVVQAVLESVPKGFNDLFFTLVEYIASDVLACSMDPDATLVNEDFKDRIRGVASIRRAVDFATRFMDIDKKRVYNPSLRTVVEGLILGA